VKPAPFQYAAPDTVEETLALLRAHGADGKLLAGGQSLVPLLNMRLARPSVLIDLNRVHSLDYIRAEDGDVVIGAMTRQREAERSPLVMRHLPLLAAALPLVGHLQIRSRGTVGGNIAHADPSAELPAVLVALEGSVVVRSTKRTRRLGADKFFVSYLTTALQPDELLTEVRFPAHEHQGTAFLEIARRHGDYALVGVAATVTMHGDRCAGGRLVFTGVGPTPVRIPEAEAAILNQVLTDAVLAEVRTLVTERIDPEDDIHASTQYRKEVAGVLAQRALRTAAARALTLPSGPTRGRKDQTP
jgi:CO/xanthine dehydrogenase FAD-binding subunit